MDIPIASLIAAIVLSGAYLAGGLLGRSEASEQFWARRRYISAAAGISVAYIFVDVLPELELQRKAVVGAAGSEETLFAEQGIYLLALLSFVVMYGLQHMVLVTRGSRQGAIAAGRVDLSYLVQLGGYLAYSALIGYLLVDRVERGVLAVVAYTFAMAVHFLIVDHSLSEEHDRSYGSRGRWLLATAVLVGWCVAVFVPLSEVVVARLFALLAGGVVITSLRAELPDDRVGRFWPFCLGSLVFAAFLMLA
ncbi:MAG: hypothetical protein KIS73_23715 [Enhydrobacter sp.]|nr:hypothetical protein [Enhydrobacter sp.]